MTATAPVSNDLSPTIQPIGDLIACDAGGERITHVSETIENALGQAPDAVLGAVLGAVLPRDLRHNLRNILSLRRYKDGRHFVGRHKLANRLCDVSLSCSVATDHVVFEMEPAVDAVQSADDFAAELRHLSNELRLAQSDHKLLEGLAGLLRVATGYDSAAIYRFSPEGGEVVADARNSTRERLLGRNLPQVEALSDVRPDGRRPIPHFISGADATQTPLRAATGVEPALDLFFCHLRGATDADLALLRELDAAAVMTVPLIMNGGLWGMALLLNRVSRTPSRYIRQLCDALASVVCDRMQILHLSVADHPAGALRRKAAAKADLTGKSVLVVEDNRLIAADLKLTLLDLGFEAVDLFLDEPSALEFLASQRADLAVLDIHLEGDANSFDVARKLAEDGTPFLFLSGYGPNADLPDELGPRPITLKPATRRKLSANIDALLVGVAAPKSRAHW